MCCSASSFAEKSQQLAGKNGVKAWHDTGQALLTQQLEAAQEVAKQANEELLAAYKRAEAVENEANSHVATKQELKVNCRRNKNLKFVLC